MKLPELTIDEAGRLWMVTPPSEVNPSEVNPLAGSSSDPSSNASSDTPSNTSLGEHNASSPGADTRQGVEADSATSTSPNHATVIEASATSDGRTEVRAKKVFPWTRGDRMVSLRDSKGKELFLIEDLTAVPPATAELIRRWLADSSFIPLIRKVYAIAFESGRQRWKVETDKGPAEFLVQEREDIRFLNDGRFTVKDVNGNTYELPPVESLDVGTQKAVASLL